MPRVYPVPNEGQSPLEFGIDASQLRTITIALDTALDKKEFKVGGSFLWAYNATDNATNVTVSFTQEAADEGILFKNGSSLGGVKYNSLFLTAAAQAGKTISFLYAVEDVRGLRIDNPAGDFSSITIVKPGQSNQIADATIAASATAVIAANTTRTRLVIESDIDNSEDIRVGTGVLADGLGLRLTPGAQQEFFTTEAVDVYGPSTNVTSPTYRYFEEYV